MRLDIFNGQKRSLLLPKNKITIVRENRRKRNGILIRKLPGASKERQRNHHLPTIYSHTAQSNQSRKPNTVEILFPNSNDIASEDYIYISNKSKKEAHNH